MDIKKNKIRVFKKRVLRYVVRIPLPPRLRRWCYLQMGYILGVNTAPPKGFTISDRAVDFNNVILGNNVDVGYNVTIITTSYPLLSELKKIYPLNYAKVIVEDEVWLGTNCILLPGVKVGHHSIVGAGVVIGQDIPPYTIVTLGVNTINPIKKYLRKML